MYVWLVENESIAATAAVSKGINPTATAAATDPTIIAAAAGTRKVNSISSIFHINLLFLGQNTCI